MLSLVLILGLVTAQKSKTDTPGDNSLSSGDSVVRGYMVKIDNQKNISKYLKKKNYAFLEEINIIQEKEEYPQGLLFVEQYVFISSYSGNRGELGKVRVYDRESGEPLLTLGLDENSHLGGIAFDGKFLWICNSSKMALERIPYAFVLQMLREQKGNTIDIRNLVELYRVNNIPSTVTYYDNQLWVATHSVWTNSTMISYRYEKEVDRLVSQDSFWIPSKVQGVAFSEKGEVYLSTSYGRKNASHIMKYDSLYAMSQNVKSYRGKIKIPPCSEGILYENKKLYILFESAGTKYLEGTDGKGKSIAPIDKILILEE